MFWYAYTHVDQDPLVPEKYPPEMRYLAAQQTPNTDTLTNWSATHEATPKRYFEAESEAEVEAFLRIASKMGQRLRVAGGGLSPNGLALGAEGVLGTQRMDRVLRVDRDKMTVTVQAGARVRDVAEALAGHGLTLQNFASIREQTVAGITQVGAHGTGARIPPFDEQVVGLRLVTPGLGALNLSNEEEPELFRLARVGLGSLGVVTQATLRVVPRHQLIERTWTATPAEVRRNHVRWLQENRHIKYLYIPYTDTVVVVACNPGTSPEQLRAAKEEAAAPQYSEVQRTEALRRLYASVHDSPSTPAASSPSAATPTGGSSGEAGSEALSATALRDALLAAGPGPLDPAWVAKVNQAEAEYWRRSAGTRVGYSDEILGFDCGGQQWVLEVSFPVASSLDSLKPGQRTKDMDFIDQLLAAIQKSNIPAPSPIEVRWTSGSSSPLSPAVGPPDSVHCWVGVIMYLPPDDQQQRDKVTQAFRAYSQLLETQLMPRFNATWHWAKLEASGRTESDMTRVRQALTRHYGGAISALQRYRAVLDPAGTLSNEWLDAVLPYKPPAAAGTSKQD